MLTSLPVLMRNWTLILLSRQKRRFLGRVLPWTVARYIARPRRHRSSLEPAVRFKIPGSCTIAFTVETNLVVFPLTTLAHTWGTRGSTTPPTRPVVGKGTSSLGEIRRSEDLVLLVELHHLWRKSVFLHHQKSVSFLSQHVQRQVFVVIVKFGSQVLIKTSNEECISALSLLLLPTL